MPSSVIDRAPVRTQGLNKWVFVPAVGSLTAPKVSELTATGSFEFQCATDGVNPSSAISPQTSALPARDCDTTVKQGLAPTQFAPFDLHVFVDPTAVDAMRAAMAHGTKGYIFCRGGVAHSTAFTAGDKLYQAWEVTCNGPWRPDATNGSDSTYGYTKQVVPSAYSDAAVVAAA
jgi:hypothetical protein